MNECTIVKFPAESNQIETPRPAKLSYEKKYPVLVANYERLLEEASKQVENVMKKADEAVKNNDAILLAHLQTVLDDLSITILTLLEVANSINYKKLRVNKLVQERLMFIRDNIEGKQVELPKEMKIEKIEMPTVSSFDVAKQEDVKNDVSLSSFPTRENVEMPLPTINNEFEKRVERYEQDFYQQKPKDTELKQDLDMGRVVKFPSRSERNIDEQRNFYTETVNSLVSDDGAYRGSLPVGKERENLDKINNRINDTASNGVDNSHNTAMDLQKAYDDFSSTEQKKKNAIDEVLRLEKEVKDAKAKLKKQLAERREKIDNLNAKTKDNIREIEDYTMHSADLRRQLNELLGQIRENSSGNEEEVSSRMRRAA